MKVLKMKCAYLTWILVASTITALTLPLTAVSLTFAGDTPMPISRKPMRVPKWSNGALMVVEYPESVNTVIWIAEGQSLHTVLFSIPGARSIGISDWDRARDGTIGLSGSATDTDGRTSPFVAWIASDERTSSVIRTSLYKPQQIAVAPDGTLWTAGVETVSSSSSRLKPQSAVIRHFDHSGHTLGAFVTQSTIGDAMKLIDLGNQFRASNDRIAWYAPAAGRYVEISFDQRVLVDTSVGRPGDPNSVVDGLAVSNQGEVFLSAVWFASRAANATDDQPSPGFRSIFVLDKSAQTWKPVMQQAIYSGHKATPSDFEQIYGIDGNRLVLRGLQRLKFYYIGN
jgi:hypothetical protein